MQTLCSAGWFKPVIALTVLAAACLLYAQAPTTAPSVPPATQPGDADGQKRRTLESGLVIETVRTPEAPLVAKPGDTVFVHYTGRLQNGQVFDTSLQVRPGQRTMEPISFELSAGRVIQGWEQGIEGMRVGEQRKLTIPPELAYGDRQVGPIPANSTLVFDVELVGIYRQ